MAHQNVWRISVRNALNRVRGVMPGNLISFFMMREKEFASAAISTRDYVRGLEGILILGSGGVSLSGTREFCIGRDFLEIRAFWFGDDLSPLSPIHAQMGWIGDVRSDGNVRIYVLRGYRSQIALPPKFIGNSLRSDFQ